MAVSAAGAQLGVEGVDDLAVYPRDWQVTERREDVDPDVPLVSVPSVVLDVQDAQVAVEQLANGGSGARVAFLVDLGEQPGATFSACAAALGPAGTCSTR